MVANWYKESQGGGFWGNLFRRREPIMSPEERIKVLEDFVSGRKQSDAQFIKVMKLIESPQTGPDILEWILNSYKFKDHPRWGNSLIAQVFKNPNVNEEFLMTAIQSSDNAVHNNAASHPKAGDNVFKYIIERSLRDPVENSYYNSSGGRIFHAIRNPNAPAWFLSYVAGETGAKLGFYNFIRDALLSGEIALENLPTEVLISVANNRSREALHDKIPALHLIKKRMMEEINSRTASDAYTDPERVRDLLSKGFPASKGLTEIQKERQDNLHELASIAVNPRTPENELIMILKSCASYDYGNSSYDDRNFLPGLIAANEGATPRVLVELFNFFEKFAGSSQINTLPIKNLVFNHPNFTREVHDVALKSIVLGTGLQDLQSVFVAGLLAHSKFITLKDLEYVAENVEKTLKLPLPDPMPYLSFNFLTYRDKIIRDILSKFILRFGGNVRALSIFKDLSKKEPNNNIFTNIMLASLKTEIYSHRLAWVRETLKGNPK